GERLAQLGVAEHLRELREDLQVRLGGMLRHQHREDERHGLAIGSLEGYGRGGAHERAHRLLEGLDAAMRYRDAVAEPRGAELLAVEEAVEDARARDLARVLEEQPDLLEQPLLAARLH